jgi:hypothetical protein
VAFSFYPANDAGTKLLDLGECKLPRAQLEQARVETAGGVLRRAIERAA